MYEIKQFVEWMVISFHLICLILNYVNTNFIKIKHTYWYGIMVHQNPLKIAQSKNFDPVKYLI